MLRPSTLAAVLLAMLPSALRAQQAAPQLAAVLAQMDTASKTFHSASADFSGELVQKVASITDVTKQKGSLYIERGKDTTFGAAVYEYDPSGAPGAKPSTVVSYEKGSLRVYSPNDNTVQQFRAGAGQTNLESYFSLGFGGSGHDLASAWTITDGGPATVNGTKTEILHLVSKDPAVRNTFREVSLWIDPTRDISLKQVFTTPSGEQRTATYTNIRLNAKINKAPYAIPSNAPVSQH